VHKVPTVVVVLVAVDSAVVVAVVVSVAAVAAVVFSNRTTLADVGLTESNG
jgi:hypothetical protein